MAKAKRQIDKFRKAARELETDNSEKRFNERLGKIAKAKPGALKPPGKRAKKRA
jgi:putative component of toxin-antitoxin plasmid stabilization module